MSFLLSSGAIDVIPDSVTSRPADDASNSISSPDVGLAFTVASEFAEIGFEISSQTTTDPTRAYLYNIDTDTLLTDVDIASLGSGDAFSIQHDYQTNTEYGITVDAEGSSFGYGYYSSPSYPYTGEDIDIIAGYDGSKRSDFAYAIVSIGDIGL